MDFNEQLSFSNSNISVSNFLTDISKETLITSILQGLTAPAKHISSMFFYDSTGSRLFEKITRLPEYYQSRIEMGLIREFAHSKRDWFYEMEILELGSGDCSKISLLLEQIDSVKMKSIHYIPLDISLEALKGSATILFDRYPGLIIRCVAADFLTQLHLVNRTKKRLFCFFGSTIGNLNIEEREKFVSTIGQLMHSDDRFLIGFDMAKPKDVLERAYNDSSNVTACFNRNILNVVNSITGTDFNVDSFQHIAFFNENKSRIEMHLRALNDMVISSPHLTSEIKVYQGETIHTENSYKFTFDAIGKLLGNAGLKIDSALMDPMNWFALVQVSKK